MAADGRTIEQQIELIEGGQIKPAADAMGRAFFDDPLQRYFIPDDSERRRLLPQFFDMVEPTSGLRLWTFRREARR